MMILSHLKLGYAVVVIIW